MPIAHCEYIVQECMHITMYIRGIIQPEGMCRKHMNMNDTATKLRIVVLM